MSATPRDEIKAIRRDVLRYLRLIGGLIAALWLIELVDALVFGGSLETLGLKPRTRAGLPGLVLHPLLHTDLAHLTANSVSLAIFGLMVLLRDERDFWAVTALAWVLGGIGTWLIGYAGNHIGASGVIFGYFGYLLLTGWFERRFGAMVLSTLVLLVWGNILFGLIPLRRGISWELHVFGFIGGVLAAWLRARRRHNAVT
jgi:membrane associated rhomboid family serine protease